MPTVAPQTQRVETPNDIAEWVQRFVYKGMQPNDAAQAAFNEAIEQGRADEVLRALGARWAFYEIWRHRVGRERYRRREEFEEEAPIDEPSFDRPEPIRVVGKAPQRRVQAAHLLDDRSLYSRPIKVAGEWVALGDLTRDHCKRLAEEYQDRAEANATLARIYETLGDGLEDDTTTIRQRFSLEELDLIWPKAA